MMVSETRIGVKITGLKELNGAVDKMADASKKIIVAAEALQAASRQAKEALEDFATASANLDTEVVGVKDDEPETTH